MKVKFGKYKGQKMSEVPREYAEWHRCNGNAKFYKDWRTAIEKLAVKNRFNKRTPEQLDSKPFKRAYEVKLEDGNYVFSVRWSISAIATRRGISNIIFYLVDSDGNYLRDLRVFGDNRTKQGARDTECEGWVTRSPTGRMMKGKMLIRPYEQVGFNWSTYQMSQETIDNFRLKISD